MSDKKNISTPQAGETGLTEENNPLIGYSPESSTTINWAKALEIINMPFPPEAIQVNSIRTGHEEVGIKPQYIVERLNQAFGLNHWMIDEVSAETGENFAKVKVFLKVGAYVNGTFIVAAERSAYGGSRITKGNLPDALKGAQTDALKKAASLFNIAGEIYKGNVTTEDAKKLEAESQGIKYEARPANTQAPQCPKDGAVMNWRVSKKGPFWGCSNYPNCNGIVQVSEDSQETETDILI